MSRGQPRDPAKEQFWRRHVARWQSSGLSIRVYCERHGLTTPSFYAWRRTLAQRDRPPQTPTAVTFLPLPVPAPSAAAGALLEIVLRNGRRLRLDPSVAADVIRDLVAVLEEQPC
jgi:transposase